MGNPASDAGIKDGRSIRCRMKSTEQSEQFQYQERSEGTIALNFMICEEFN